MARTELSISSRRTSSPRRGPSRSLTSERRDRAPWQVRQSFSVNEITRCLLFGHRVNAPPVGTSPGLNDRPSCATNPSGALGPARRRGFHHGRQTLLEIGSASCRVAESATALSLCEGEDLNLHGSYPASTSTQRECKITDRFTRLWCSERHENAVPRTDNREIFRETPGHVATSLPHCPATALPS